MVEKNMTVQHKSDVQLPSLVERPFGLAGFNY